MRVAIVEDDPSQAELLSHWLRRGGHQSHHFDRGATAIRALSQDSFDVLVLDWNLRDISGVEVLRRIRGSGQSSLPILFASARGREEDVVSALRQGADDYMIKPVRHLEFIARLEAIARRGKHHTEQPEVLKLDVYHVDGLSRTLMRDGRPVELTTKDFDLSVLFLCNVGQLLSRDHICERVWGRRRGGHFAHARHPRQPRPPQARIHARERMASRREIRLRLSPAAVGRVAPLSTATLRPDPGQARADLGLRNEVTWALSKANLVGEEMSPASQGAFAPLRRKENLMLYYAADLLVIAIVAAILGFTGIAAGAAEIAKILFFVFLVIFIVTLIMGVRKRP